ncbi:CRP-like cAMP-binding protein [Aquimarina sp. MAR_2010_214]|uniref:Crp/Fnr family transcriptional regulator n=1 Tax=Aquimarina sp. MAR_2010_214 TaxID=1250026 RepID=UPI000C70152A|nr:Crp/Fnr family transcriptional regulator [Aquimarina sp. MAR_2010_214]PKV52889.1 CRP-like cAMP-binding protein [Aquimarina sp. MAR_2010_214]
MNSNIFKKLSSDVLLLIEETKIPITLKKRQVLFYEGTIPSGIYVLKKGKIKKYSTGLSNKEHIFSLVKENEIFGHHNLLCDEVYSYSVACLTDCLFYLIPKEVFLSIIETNHEIRYLFLKDMSREFGMFINNSMVMAQHSVRERTALSIIKLENFFDENGSFSLSRRDHSNIVGTSIESLARVLYDFKKEKIIEIKEKTIKVIDMKKLIAATNFV